jgi:hypothetical protein
MGSSSLLASLSVDQPPFGLIIYQNQSGIKYTLKNIEVQNIDIQITDENYNYINFNNIDWSFVFCIYTVYDLTINPNAPLIHIQDTNESTSKPKPKDPELPPNPEFDQLEFLSS